MSVSTDAILCFGVELDEGFIDDFFDEDERDDLEHYLDEKFDMSKLQLVVPCHSAEPMYIIAIKKPLLKHTEEAQNILISAESKILFIKMDSKH